MPAYHRYQLSLLENFLFAFDHDLFIERKRRQPDIDSIILHALSDIVTEQVHFSQWFQSGLLDIFVDKEHDGEDRE